MEHAQFVYDYGILPEEVSPSRILTNLTELIWGDEIVRTLRLCGRREREIGAAASDFEKWNTLCQSLPLLQGHWLPQYLSFVLKACFAIDTPATPENAHAFWRQTAEQLQAAPRTLWQALQAQGLGNEVHLRCNIARWQSLPREACPVWDLNELTKTSAPSWEAWKCSMEEQGRTFLQAGGRLLSLCLPATYRFSSPNPHLVGTILAKQERSNEDTSILLTQAIRGALVALNGEVPLLHLRISGNAEEAVKLLSYLNIQVGLPSLAWSCAEDPLPMLRLASEESFATMLTALSAEDLLARALWERSLRALTSITPRGRLQLFTAAEIRQIPFARAELGRALASLEGNSNGE